MLTQEQDVKPLEKGMPLQEFEAAFRTYYSVLYRYAYSFTRDDDQAKDVVADVFLQVWTKRQHLSITVSAKSYLFAMVKHQALRQVKTQHVAMKVSGDYLCALPAEQASPLEKYLSLESAQYLETLISQLPALRQEILELKLFGLKNREIAETLSLTEKQVEYQLGQAVEALRFQIKKYQPQDRLVLEALAFVNIAIMVS